MSAVRPLQPPPPAANDDARRPPLTDAQRRLAAVLADLLYRDLRANPPPR